DPLTWFEALSHACVPLLIPGAYRDLPSFEAVVSCVDVNKIGIGFEHERIHRHDHALARRHHDFYLRQHLWLESVPWITDSAAKLQRVSVGIYCRTNTVNGPMKNLARVS